MTERENEVEIAALKARQDALKEASEKADADRKAEIDGLSKKLWAVVMAVLAVFIKLVADFIGTRGP